MQNKIDANDVPVCFATLRARAILERVHVDVMLVVSRENLGEEEAVRKVSVV
jgi:hypothetical protein